jgi:hypothetical protein
MSTKRWLLRLLIFAAFWAAAIGGLYWFADHDARSTADSLYRDIQCDFSTLALAARRWSGRTRDPAPFRPQCIIGTQISAETGSNVWALWPVWTPAMGAAPWLATAVGPDRDRYICAGANDTNAESTLPAGPAGRDADDRDQ